MHRFIRMVIALAVAAAIIPFGSAPADAADVPAEGVVHGGIFSDVFLSAGDIDALNNASGRKITFQGTFQATNENATTTYSPGTYSNTFTILNQVWQAQATPFVKLNVPGTAAQIAGGSFDAQIRGWATHVKAFLDQGGGRSLIIAPLQEMNGNWVSYGCSPGSAVTAYRRVVDIFRNEYGLNETKVRWAWAPNGWTPPGCGSLAQYYPGHSYVDITGFSAYNFGTCVGFGWETPYQVLINPVNTIRSIAPDKPMVVAQTAAPRNSCGAPAGQSQDTWVRDLFAFVRNDPNLVGLVWFNIDKTAGGETNWKVWQGGAATQGWRDAMSHSGTHYQWPLTSWFQPGQLFVGTPPGPPPCPQGRVCDTMTLIKSNGQWFRWPWIDVGVPVHAFYFGNPGDIPFVGDWNGDGIKTPGLYRQSDGFVYLRLSNTQGNADITFYFGNPGDFPIVGDFNGNGRDTVSIYRPSQGRFFIINTLGQNGGGLGAADYDVYFGNPGDRPFVGDFNGNGQDSIGLYRQSTGFVYFRNTLTTGVADNQFFFGNPGDVIMAGDWNGDGFDTVGVYRPSTGRVYLKFSNSAGGADYTLNVGSFVGASRS